MCGVAGLISNGRITNGEQLVKKAAATLSHRGPEEQGFWTNESGQVIFGHRRLCIIDRSKSASQPMQYANRYTLIYNGEIYNYLEVKEALQKKGHQFRSHSDTEVILAAYAQWNVDCLQHFDGAFAFAIWDEKEQTFFAARDRFGEKPFFFHYDNDVLAFASEIKALWDLGIKKEVNTSLLYNFLTIGYTVNPSDNTETFYNTIQKLPAAHYLIYSFANKQVKLEPYWQLYIQDNKAIKEDEAIEQFKTLFSKSIHKRLRSDVPIGTSLSGGLDSSAIVAFCASENADLYTYKCFTASFKGFEKDETAYAAIVAKRFHLQHHLTTVNENEVADLMDAVATQQDEPFSSASVLAQYKVFQLAKEQGVTVLLDGQGADEVLAGYHKYYKWYWQELYRTNQLRKSGELAAAKALNIDEAFGVKNKLAAMLPDFASALLQNQKSKKAYRHPNFTSDFAFANKRNSYYSTPLQHHLNGALYYNTFVNGLEELLRLADRNSMAHSIEVRLPFLQHQLVEFLFTLPPHFKIHKGWTKWLLRRATENVLPHEIVWRRDKTGYEPPQKQWMNNKAVQEKIRAAKEQLVKENILNKDALHKPIVAKAAHEAESFDWRYWSAAKLFL